MARRNVAVTMRTFESVTRFLTTRSARRSIVSIALLALVVTGASPSTDPRLAEASVNDSLSAASAPVATDPSRRPIWGFADTHNHQFSYLAFGGLVVWGAAFSHDGNIATALPWSDWTPSQRGLCPGQSPTEDPACSAEVVNPAGAPVGLVICPTLGLPNCPPNSPVLSGTCPPGEFFCAGVLVHGAGGVRDLINTLLSGSLGHLVGGNPEFNGWPRWNNYTGQQVYYEWLKRAHDGGLQLMVMNAVNNEVLCNFSDHVASFGCEDMPAVDRQIQAAKDLEAFIDARSGGPGTGWYRIAYSGQQAREIINAGKLAVVLGVEVPGIFGCKKNSACTPDDVRTELQRYYDMGVRHIFPVHIADNAFGGTALYNSYFEFVNKLISGDWWDVENCPPTSGVDFHLDAIDAIADLAQRAEDPGSFDIPAQFARAAGLNTSNAPPAPPSGSNCNARALAGLGVVLIDEMMKKGMIIDVDHMSGKTLDLVLQAAAAKRYPGIAMGHTGYIETGRLNPGGVYEYKRHEGNKTAAQIESLRSLGGLSGAILHQGSTYEIKQYQRPDGTYPVPFVCGNSSEAWAQAYLYGAEKMRSKPSDRWPEDPPAVAIGSDFNGLAGMPAPRFGDEKCNGNFPDLYVGPGRSQVSYPFQGHGVSAQFDAMHVGNRDFNINVDGLANVGMYPDFVEELKQDGMSSTDLEALFNSAEAYVRMWERSEDRTPPEIVCASADTSWHATDVSFTCSATDAVSSLENAADDSFTLSTAVTAGTETANASTGTRTVCDRRLNCGQAGPISGVKVDKKSPTITTTVPAAASYDHSATLTLDYAVTDGGSGLDVVTSTLDGASTQAGHGLSDGQQLSLLTEVSLGTHTFAINAKDKVANVSSASVTFTVVVSAESIKEDIAILRGSGAIASDGLATSLLSKLDAAGSASAKGNCNVSVLQYQSFIKQLQALSGKGVTQAAAAIMTEDARYLIDHCP